MASVWGELKRRNVVRVAVAYVIIAWLILQVVDVINEPLSLPDWFDTVVILLLAFGLPIALILSWAFDLTARGIVRTKHLDKIDETSQQSMTTETEEQEFALDVQANSLAVLPFANMSDDSRSTSAMA